MQEILGRVAINRVFDIEGVWEVLSEISADCQSPISARDPSHLAKVAEDLERTSGQMTTATNTTRIKGLESQIDEGGEKELEIGDSEAEEEDIDLEEEVEEADISHTDNTGLAPDNTNPQHSFPQKDPTLRSKPPESKGRTEIIIIDNMTTPISELFSRRERSFGTSQPFPSLHHSTILPKTKSANPSYPIVHTFLSTFFRTLHTLSQTHNILTLLLNTLTSPAPPRASSREASHPSASRLPLNPISVFAATTARPALGKLFSDLCALHLLVTSVPKTATDAGMLYASPPDPGDDEEPYTSVRDLLARGREEGKTEVEYVFVVEVLKDVTGHLDAWLGLDSDRGPYERSGTSRTRKRKRKRKQNRAQRWAPFAISLDGLTLESPFPGMTGKPMSALGQMHIVKQFPFGRRL